MLLNVKNCLRQVLQFVMSVTRCFTLRKFPVRCVSAVKRTYSPQRPNNFRREEKFAANLLDKLPIINGAFGRHARVPVLHNTLMMHLFSAYASYFIYVYPFYQPACIAIVKKEPASWPTQKERLVRVNSSRSFAP